MESYTHNLLLLLAQRYTHRDTIVLQSLWLLKSFNVVLDISYACVRVGSVAASNK